MIKTEITVPSEVSYLSDWIDFDSHLPQRGVIVDKGICGCGGTEYYLRNDKPVLLLSPRLVMLKNKMTGNDQRIHKLHYFDRSRNFSLDTSINQLRDYLNAPFQPSNFVPKIICTYDSAHNVLKELENCENYEDYVIVVDEFTSIFDDAQFKGATELKLMQNLNSLHNHHIVYLSATPIPEEYLDKLDCFKHIPYVTLAWNKNRYEKIRVVRQNMKSTIDAASRVILSYRQNNFFKSTIENDNTVYSYEAVFFLNDVSDICSIIKKNGLTPDDTLVICANSDKNRKRLKEIGFDIGEVPGKETYQAENRTFTFVTRASFEGTDFYSDSSSYYVFADPDANHLALDISTQIAQIAGRCRNKNNIFRMELTYFYKTKIVDTSLAEKIIEERREKTDRLLKWVKSLNQPDMYNDFCEKLISAQEKQQYSKDYLDVFKDSNGNYIVEGNQLVHFSELRALEIKREQYKNNFSVYCYLSGSGFYSADKQYANNNTLTESFLKDFFTNQDFSRRMKVYTDFMENQSNLRGYIESIPSIPMNIKEFYRNIEADKIRALRYREKDLENWCIKLGQFNEIKTRIGDHIRTSGKTEFTRKEIKKVIQKVYDDLKIDLTAKATDIKDYFPNAKETRINGEHGYRP